MYSGDETCGDEITSPNRRDIAQKPLKPYTAANAKDAVLSAFDGLQHGADREQKTQRADLERKNRKRI